MFLRFQRGLNGHQVGQGNGRKSDVGRQVPFGRDSSERCTMTVFALGGRVESDSSEEEEEEEEEEDEACKVEG